MQITANVVLDAFREDGFYSFTIQTYWKLKEIMFFKRKIIHPKNRMLLTSRKGTL